MNILVSTKKLSWSDTGIAIIRIVVGLFLLYHGKEVFDAAKIKEYASWDQFKGFSHPIIMPYLGKGAEFIGGALLFLGLYTRVGCLIIMGTLGYISFFIGKGIIWMDDQHPFLFVLLAFFIFIMGPGAWSADGFLFNSNKNK